jgi:hypothetical protein
MHARSRRRLGLPLERFLTGLIWLDPTAAAYCKAFEMELALEEQGDALDVRERRVARGPRGPRQPVAERPHVVRAGGS